MNSDSQQPRKSDAVLGGKTQLPLNAAVLGGIEGVKSRLESSNVEGQIGALREALNYGETGLEIVTQALYNRSGAVKLAAYKILKVRSEPAAQQALAEVNPYQFFQCVHTIKTSDRYVHSVAISPDNKTIVSGGGTGQDYNHTAPSPGLWNLETGKQQSDPRFNHNKDINWVAISPNGERMISASADKSIIIFDLTFGRVIHQRRSEGSNIFYAVVIDPNGENFYTSDNNGFIKIWKWNKESEIATIQAHSGAIHAICISADGKLLITGGIDGLVKVWDLNTRQEIWKTAKYTHSMRSAAISPNGHTLVGGSDQRIKIWDIYSRREVLSFYGHADWVRSIIFSPDGKSFITAGDENIKVWDAASGKKIYSFIGHTEAIRCLALSSDGQILVSGGADGNVKIWRL